MELEPYLTNYLDDFCAALKQQLEGDEKRWGGTWIRRTRQGQEDRTFERFRDYKDMFDNAGTPVPWLKVAGEAMICWAREQNKDLFPK